MMNFADKRAVVIGAASGLGKALAELLTASGYAVKRIVTQVLSEQRSR